MNLDILHLQDKIRYLEAQMVTSPSTKGDPQGNEHSYFKTFRPQIQDQGTVTLDSGMT